MDDKPWIVGGDFNVILNEEEKMGSLEFEQYEVMDFAMCINSCTLMEVRYTGSNFTWRNGRVDEAYIFKRLDRVLVNNAFMELFLTSEVHHLMRQGSDHAPLHLICNTEEPVNIKSFRFLNF